MTIEWHSNPTIVRVVVNAIEWQIILVQHVKPPSCIQFFWQLPPNNPTLWLEDVSSRCVNLPIAYPITMADSQSLKRRANALHFEPNIDEPNIHKPNKPISTTAT